jgi:hypothetical protein
MVHRDVERSASVDIPDLRVGSVIQKELRNIVATGVERNHQGSDTFKIAGNVDVRTCADKGLDTPITAAYRIQKRGQPAVGVILSPGLGRHLGWPVRGFGAGFHIGALRKKKLHHLFRVLICGSGPH